ncbi:MAG: hypothetical protein EOP48_27380 [Sphingobacteriales bacterium]|nr:MAG: hypothetical protein EOP48_27380 [Sphingobacteriales bacterium]
MKPDTTQNSLETLVEIRSIMERSTRFLSLSGWSGVWAGVTALAGAGVALRLLPPEMLRYSHYGNLHARDSAGYFCFCGADFYKPIALALVVFLIALAGGVYFTWKKSRHRGASLWNKSSRAMVGAMVLPLVAGAVFTLSFMHYGHAMYIAPACLIFYGLALINGSKYTVTDIKYLGILEVILGSLSLFFPGYGLAAWALGFGILHIVYGIVMWNKYDKNGTRTEA